jgi:hypothetical protein
MSETPGTRGEEADYGYQKPLGDNAFLQFVQRPRILLILLAAWEIVGVLVELAASSSMSLDIEGGLDGVLAGRLLSWQAVPLAVLYLYCARDPVRYQRIFWLALIEQAAAVAANLYHVIADHLEIEAIFIPVVVSASLGLLAFLNVFQRREPERELA